MPSRPKQHKPLVQPCDRRQSSCQRGYGYRWQREREAYLRLNPLCATCALQGRSSLATVVDHIVPHRGDATLFWDVTNWQSLCDAHHNEKTGKGQ
jgi:5-methylcytosine-specific restriction enzyme A